MADLAKIKRNVAKMAAMNAPESDIDGYIASEGVTIDDVKNFKEIHGPQMSDAQIATLEANQQRHKKNYSSLYAFAGSHPEAIKDIAKDAVTGTAEGLQIGVEKAFDGASLGGYSWANRKLGGNFAEREAANQRLAEDAGLGGANKLAKFAAEMGANVGGAGAAIYKGLSKAGLKGAKLAAASGALEGGIYNATGSDTLGDATTNALAGMAIGGVLGGAADKGLRYAGELVKALRPEATAKSRALGKILENVTPSKLRGLISNAQRLKSNIAAVGDNKLVRLAQLARQQTDDAADMIEDRLIKLADSRPDETRWRMAFNFGNEKAVPGQMQHEYSLTGKYQNIDDIISATKEKARPLYDKLSQIGDLDAYALGKKGSKELAGRLGTQKFSDIDFGRMSSKKLAQLNAIRAENGLQPLTADMKIPLNVVKKLYDKRLVHDKMKPEDIADMAFDAFHNPQNIVDVSKYPHIQAVISPKEELSNVGFISHDPSNGETVVKTVYKEKNERLKNTFKKLSDVLDGRARLSSTNPSSVSGDKTPVAAARFSALQDIAHTGKISSLGKYVNSNDFIKNKIAAVRKDLTLPSDVRRASNTDFKILDEVKRKIDDDIEIAKRAGENNKVMRLVEQKNELLKRIDKVIPEYKQARNLYEAQGKALAAQKIGEDIFDQTVSPELLAKKMKDMEHFQTKSLKIGGTAEMLRRIGMSGNEAVALGKLLNDNTRKKLELVYGKPAAKNFLDYAQSEVLRNRNTNKILYGSQTPEKQALRDETDALLAAAKSPLQTVGIALEGLFAPAKNSRNKAIADILTAPSGKGLAEALNKELERQQKSTFLKAMNSPLVAALAGRIAQD